MNKKVVLFDIDYTLFNSKKYREQFTVKIQKAIGYSGDDFSAIADETYQSLRKQVAYFDPALYSEMLSERLSMQIDAKKIEDIVFDEQLLEESLYDDTVDVLETLSQQPYLSLGIFSAGLHHAQRLKIKKVEAFLQSDHLHIFNFKKHHALPELLEKYKEREIYLVDDMVHVLYEAKKIRSDMYTIWIKRPERSFLDSQVDNFTPDSIIKSLREILPIVLEKEIG